MENEVNTPAKFNLFKFIFGADPDQTFKAFGGWLKKWVAIVNIVLIPLFRLMLIALMAYAIFFTYRYYTDLQGGNGFIFGAQQLEERAGSPVNCYCVTPKGNLAFNSSFMSSVGYDRAEHYNVWTSQIKVNLSKFTNQQIQAGEFKEG